VNKDEIKKKIQELVEIQRAAYTMYKNELISDSEYWDIIYKTMFKRMALEKLLEEEGDKK